MSKVIRHWFLKDHVMLIFDEKFSNTLDLFQSLNHLVLFHHQTWLSLLKETSDKLGNVLNSLPVHQLTLLSQHVGVESHIVHLDIYMYTLVELLNFEEPFPQDGTPRPHPQLAGRDWPGCSLELRPPPRRKDCTNVVRR